MKYFNRYTQQIETERVYGGKWIQLGYGTRLGRVLLQYALTGPWLSRLYGFIQTLRVSAKKIPKFIRQYQIQMNEFEDTSFQCFNDFFIRRFKPNTRRFSLNADELGAFAEGRYSGVQECAQSTLIPVKGASLNPLVLIQNKKWADQFLGGPCLVARLCPVDYHRFHYPDHGRVLDSYRCSGPLHSVNPAAFTSFPEVLIRNERHVTILETQNFGLLAYVEVGALCVGKIVQTHPEKTFSKGQEKGYFLFGGSTVIVLGQPGRWIISKDILDQTALGLETYVHLGDEVGFSR